MVDEEEGTFAAGQLIVLFIWLLTCSDLNAYSSALT